MAYNYPEPNRVPTDEGCHVISENGITRVRLFKKDGQGGWMVAETNKHPYVKFVPSQNIRIASIKAISDERIRSNYGNLKNFLKNWEDYLFNDGKTELIDHENNQETKGLGTP